MSVVHEFHAAFGLPAPAAPTIPNAEMLALRARLVREEFKEANFEFSRLLGVLRNGESPSVVIPILQALLKELTDLRYACEGSMVAFGLDPEDLMAEVHRSNMSKRSPDDAPVTDLQGKVLKGPNYEEVNPERLFPGVYDEE